MAQTIDELQIKISSDASSAITQLDRLASAMSRVGSSASSVATAAHSIDGLTQSLKALATVDFSDTKSKMLDIAAVSKRLKSKDINIKFSISGLDNIEKLKNLQMPDANIKGDSNGINSTINAFRRLSESKPDVSSLKEVASLVKDISQTGDVSSRLNGFVSSLARLANAGEKTEKTATGLRVLVPRLKEAVVMFQGLGDMSASVNQFVSSLARLASAGEKTGQTAANLKDLAAAVVAFLNAVSNAPEINNNLAMTIQGLGNLASAGRGAGQALNTSGLVGSGKGGFGHVIADGARAATAELKKLVSGAVSLGGQGARAIANFASKVGLIPRLSSDVDRTAISFGNLLRSVLPFFGIRGIFDWAKDAVNTGSSLVEIENVIDTAFGDLKKGYEDISGYVYDWSKSTIDAFGVSELAAKQYAGRLMSMFNSSGFDLTEGMRDSAAKMSTDLIERAGDIASFYDISVDEAMTKIQSGLAGMTRPLRSIGVNMSVANLQAFALSQGITQSWQSMDQATQMALRYQYILNATQYAQGDFARTSGRVCAPCYRKVA